MAKTADVLIPLGLAAAAAVLLESLRQRLGISGLALGSDPDLWALNAENLWIGANLYLPPLYPAFIALTRHIGSLALVDAGLGVSAAAYILSLPAAYAAARSLGATPLFAAIGAAALFMHPTLVFFGLQLQPDSMTLVMLLCAVPLVVWYQESPTLRRTIPLALYGGAGYLLREHGLAMAALFGAVALVLPGKPALRVARGTLVGAALLLAPLAVGHGPALPWNAPWSTRIDQALQAQENIPVHGNAEQQATALAHIAAHQSNSRADILKAHAKQSFKEATEGWGWMALAFLALPLIPPKRRIAAALPMIPSFPALFILSQDRHVLVALPVAAVAVAAAMSRRTLWSGLVGVAAVGALTTCVSVWRPKIGFFQMNAEREAPHRDFGRALCALIDPGDIVAGEVQHLSIYCPMPRTGFLGYGTGADWRTWYIGSSSPGPYWLATGLGESTPLYGMDGQLFGFRMLPSVTGEDRPCQGSLPLANTPYFAVERPVAQTWPDCFMDPGMVANTNRGAGSRVPGRR